jgi:type IV secretion system protein VirD4
MYHTPPRGGVYWVLYALLVPFLGIMLLAGAVTKNAQSCTIDYATQAWDKTCVRDGDPGLWNMAVLVVVATCLAGVGLGVRDGRRRTEFAHGRVFCLLVVAVFNTASLIAYCAGYLVGQILHGGGGKGSTKGAVVSAPVSDHRAITCADDPYLAVSLVAARAHGAAGGHIGWDDRGSYLGARPRGGMLVIGPPGSGKSAAVVIPSVLVAPGAVVSTSIKGDVMAATATVRALRGRVWHFDPGGAEQAAPGVVPARWSPLVGIRSWDEAQAAASRMAEPAMNQGQGGGGGDHFTERARDWLEVLLYAAVLDNHPISTVARWAQTPDATAVEQEVNSALIFAAANGDAGAEIARGQLAGLLDTPDRERGSVKSTLARILRVYSSTAARQLGDTPNFDPAAFVRSCDTLYITASPDKQKAYAPLVAGLLEAIRYAVYARHHAQETGAEPRRHHVTFVLDEANNTAPIPLPAIISEAGGQSLHVVVGIQDLSRARERWGRAAEGFLTLFPTKVVLNGVVEPYTLDALSNAAGEYDRVMTSYSESTSYVGQYNIAVRQQNPSYSVNRQKVLHQGDIARLPPGKALVFEGAAWVLVNIRTHFADPVWRRVAAWPAELAGIEARQSAHLPAAQKTLTTGEEPDIVPQEEAAR